MYKEDTRSFSFPDFLFRSQCGSNAFLRDSHTELNWVNTRSAEGCPDWKGKIREHKNATTVLRGTRTRVELPIKKLKGRPVLSDFLSYWNRYGHTDCFVPPAGSVPTPYLLGAYGIPWDFSPLVLPLVPDVVPYTTFNEAVGAFYKKAREAQTEFHSGAFLGELREALAFLAHPATAFRRALGQYVRSLRKGAALPLGRRVNFVRESWLEWSFAMQPLMSDVAAGARALASFETRIDDFKRVTGFAKSSALVSTTTSNREWNAHELLIQQTRTEGQEFFVKVYGQVRCGVADKRSFEASKFGFTPDNFVPDLYEIIPLSWVIDYFTNLGDVINAYSTLSRSIAWMSLTTSRTRFVQCDGRPLLTNQPVDGLIDVDLYNFVPIRITSSIVDRGPNPDLIKPSFIIKIPGFSTKWINLAAFIGSAKATSRILRA